MKLRRCDDCEFFGLFNPVSPGPFRCMGDGFCHARPPKNEPTLSGQPAARYPVVHVFDWCGLWTARADEAKDC